MRALGKCRKVAIDLLHIDASHEYKAVKEDLRSWWPLVEHSRGVMFGDDYLGHWKEVKRAVDDFAAEMSLPVWQVDDDVHEEWRK